jgi:hypothetical protein
VVTPISGRSLTSSPLQQIKADHAVGMHLPLAKIRVGGIDSRSKAVRPRVAART